MVKEIMGMSPLFGQFMAEKGLNFILDNMEGKGIEQLKDLTEEWLQEYQKEKQQALQAQQQNPAAMKAQMDMKKMEMQAQQNQQKNMIDMAKLQAEQQKLQANLHLGKQDATVALIKAQTERFAKQTDLDIKKFDVSHEHLRKAFEAHHKVRQGEHKRHASTTH
jgi:hypothetical protein